MVKAKTPRAPKKVIQHIPAYNMLGIGGLTGTAQRGPPDPLRQLEADEVEEQRKMINNLRHEELILRRENRIDREQKKQDSFRGKGGNDQLESYKRFMELQNMALNMNAKKEDPITEAVKAIVPMAFNALMAPQPDPVEQIARYQQLGLIPQHGTAGEHNKFSVELEKIRGERMLLGKQHDLQLYKLQLEQANRQEMLETAAKIIGPLLGVAGGEMAKKMEQKGMTAAIQARNPGFEKTILNTLGAGATSPGSLQGETAEMLIRCDCGYDKVMLVPVPPPQVLSCPGCGKTLLTGSDPSVEKELKEQWRAQK